MLMVDGVLYMWVRNANQAGQQCQLAGSTDHAERGPGARGGSRSSATAFLNFGRDYPGARDDFVYMYSPDSPSGTIETGRIVLTRVPRGQILESWRTNFMPDSMRPVNQPGRQPLAIVGPYTSFQEAQTASMWFTTRGSAVT